MKFEDAFTQLILMFPNRSFTLYYQKHHFGSGGISYVFTIWIDGIGFKFGITLDDLIQKIKDIVKPPEQPIIDPEIEG